jgi:hypothetical protein
MVRKSMNLSRARDAAAWAALSPAERMGYIREFRAALLVLSDDSHDEMPAWLRDESAAAVTGSGDGSEAACRTCGGSGRLKHPRTGKPSRQCPECDGTGSAPPDDDSGDAQASGRYARHVRFQGGEVRELPVLTNSARRPDPRQEAALDAAWNRLARGLD